MRTSLACVVFAVVLSACSSSRHVMLDDASAFPPTRPQTVAVLDRAPERAHRRLATVFASKHLGGLETVADGYADAMKRLRSEAGAIGADAVVSPGDAEAGSMGSVGGLGAGGGAYTVHKREVTVHGVAIKYTDGGPGAEPKK